MAKENRNRRPASRMFTMMAAAVFQKPYSFRSRMEEAGKAAKTPRSASGP